MTKKSFWKKWGIVIVTAMSLFVVVIDTTILNVSMADVKNDLNTDLPTIQWAITIYALVMAAFLILGGKLADIFGRKKMFLIGIVLYGIGTLTAALAQDATTLIIGWSILEGLGGAIMMPATQSLITEHYSGKDRSIAMGIWGGVAGAGAAFGPIFGGYLTTNASWRWAFGLEIVIVVVAIALSYVIPKSKGLNKKEKLDKVGFALSSLSLTSLVYGIIESSDYGWWKAKKTWELFGNEISFGDLSITPIFITISMLLMTAFVWWIKKEEKEKKSPLINLNIFKSKQFTSSIIVIGLMALSQAGIMFTIAPLLQGVRGYNAFETGITFLPMSIAMMITAPLSSKLDKIIKSKYLIQIGLVLSIISGFIMRSQTDVNIESEDLIIGMAMFGMGMGMVMAQITNMVMSAVKKKEAGQASGLNSTVRQVGMALGTAVVGTVLLTSMTSGFTDGVKNSKVLPSQVKESITKQVDNEGMDSLSHQPSSEKNTENPISQELKSISDNAIAEGSKDTYYYTSGFFVLALIASAWLPKEVSEIQD